MKKTLTVALWMYFVAEPVSTVQTIADVREPRTGSARKEKKKKKVMMMMNLVSYDITTIDWMTTCMIVGSRREIVSVQSNIEKERLIDDKGNQTKRKRAKIRRVHSRQR